MGFLRGTRLFAAPAARLTGVAAAGILAISVVAGLVRVLPLFLAPGVPLRLAPVLARGIAAVSLETALFVAPPIGWALAASRLVDRGEARALFAVGVRPLRILAAGWPAAIGVALAAALAAALWGREASAPGRIFRELLAEGRVACDAARVHGRPAVADVPLVGLSWICVEGRAPRVVGPAPVGSGAFAASALEVSDDLRALDATDLEILVPGAEGRPEARVRAAEASIHGLAPLGRASNLSVAARAFSSRSGGGAGGAGRGRGAAGVDPQPPDGVRAGGGGARGGAARLLCPRARPLLAGRLPRRPCGRARRPARRLRAGGLARRRRTLLA